MNYDETFAKRDKLIIKADSITENYLELATELLEKSTNFLHTSSVVYSDIDSDGITFEFWINDYDFTQGKSQILISKEILDKNINSFLRKKKLKILK
jgi:hypothetical protein